MTRKKAQQQMAQRDKFEQWFSGRHWRVASEVSGERAGEAAGLPPDCEVRYQDGFFAVRPPHVFRTPLGHSGRQGYLITETDADGNDLPGAIRAAFGRTTLTRAVREYGAVSGLPAKDPVLT
jgi:hypothetical protein